MPIYDITDPRSGQTVSIEADSPPSQGEGQMILLARRAESIQRSGGPQPEGGIIPTLGKFSETPLFPDSKSGGQYITPGLLAGFAPLLLGPVGAGISAGARGLSMLPKALQLAGRAAGWAIPKAGYAADIGLLGSEGALNLQRGETGTAALNVARSCRRISSSYPPS